uniref:Sperm-associated antigen 5 n=1 Tax=Mola mola TaxID=94237 RepID=A0A3Q3W259_MOLML
MCTETACGLGDITFKSFVCPGGEVEIKDSLLCAEESIILPKDQAMKDTCEDTVISDSMIAQTYSELMEHPYQNPEMNDAALVDINAASLFENTSQASIHLDEKSDFCGSKDVTWKSFVCDGGEVEVLDVTKRQDETIPLPEAQLGDHVQDHSVNTTDLSAFEQLHEAEHADHPYCSSEKGVAVVATFSETTKYLEEPADGLSDVTFKSMNCTGGEIQISDSTTLVDMTITLPADQTSAFSRSYSCDVDPSMSTCHQSVQNINEHLDHPYSNIESHRSTPNVNVAISQNPPPVSPGDVDEAEHDSLVLPNGQTKREKPVSLIISGSEVEESGGTQLSQEASPLLEDQATICLPLDYHSVSTSHTEDQIQGNYKEPNSHLENNEVVVDTDPPAISTSSLTNAFFTKLVDKSINFQMQENCKKDSASLSMPHRTESPDCSCLAASAETPTPMEVHQEHVCQEQVRSGSNQSRKVKDSALGSSGNDAVLCNSADKPHAETFPDVLKMLSECPSISSALQLGLISPVVKRASLFLSGGKKDHAVDQFMSDYSPLEMEKSLLAPVDVNPTGLWAEHLESPMPGPLFNSTAVGCKSQPGSDAEVVEDVKHCVVPQSDVEKPPLDIPLIPDGPLQQQLRQMAEFLFLASGKIGPAPAYASLPPPAVTTVPVTTATSVESYSVGVGTTPLKVVDHSINTSGQFEKKRDFSVADSCTLTDPLLWNLPPGSLDCVPKQELEQRLKSSMIMVEALVQQLATARAHSCAAGPAPSDLREKLVQTDHTELSQATMHKELYLQALSRIGELELDGSSLQNLIQCMQDMKVTMAFSAMDQLRSHCAMEISELERIAGSQQNLSAALDQTYPELVTKNTETPKSSTHNLHPSECRGNISVFSEMGVLRQKLTEREEERGQLERQVTELSATVSSTLASYTFLEQALAAETTKYEPQNILRIINICSGTLFLSASRLDTSLGQSEQRVRELNQALAQSEEQLSQLQTLSQSQHMEIQQLQDVCAQLSGVREMNEFLQMENELAREQMAESECMLRANLQGLRERNLECEDLKGELSQLQLENRSLQEELETTRSQASVTQLGLGEKLAQAGTEIALLHHTLRGLTNELNAALDDQVLLLSKSVSFSFNFLKFSQELRKQVVELRRSFQQSKVESQFLRGELSRTAGQSAPPAHFMEEKIQLLKEVERLKLCLQEEEQARVKLLERAKRHTLLSLPDVVKNSEQLQQLVEYIG